MTFVIWYLGITSALEIAGVGYAASKGEAVPASIRAIVAAAGVAAFLLAFTRG